RRALARVQRRESFEVSFRIGFASPDVLGRDDHLKAIANVAAFENHFDFVAQSARGDRQWIFVREPSDELHYSGIKRITLVDRGLASDQFVDERRVVRLSIAPRAGERSGETAAIVVAQIFFVVILIAQRDPLLGQNRAEQFKVYRLVVNDHAVEIKYDDSQSG